MTEDEMNPDICPSALEEDGTLDRSKWDGAHKWSEDVTYNQQGEAQYECNECGTTKPIPFKCPLCGSDEVRHVEQGSTHIYVCQPCPFIAFEFVHLDDLDKLTEYLNR